MECISYIDESMFKISVKLSGNNTLLKLHSDMQPMKGGCIYFWKNQLSKMIGQGYYGYLKKKKNPIFSMPPECRYLLYILKKYI